VRDLLRLSGYKPTGRGKPASEYLVRAAGEGTLGTINAAVDACNAVSLHSGFPISVVDLELARGPFHIGVAPAGSSYVFNSSGQEIDLGGLLCLFDGASPCANAVRDSQRTKTRAETRAMLSVIWGCAGYEPRLAVADGWYRELLTSMGARTESVLTTSAESGPQ
jgi:DNA/RNA-binding domain of Phe-tRNA-synthetase-like protein